MLQGPHVVCSVRDLDQDHPEILGHRQDHLPEVLSLALFFGTKADLAELGHTINQLCDVPVEHLAQVFEGGVRILDRVVQKRGTDGLFVELQLRRDACNSHGVADIGVTIFTTLCAVRLLSEHKGALDQVAVKVRVVGRDRIKDVEASPLAQDLPCPQTRL